MRERIGPEETSAFSTLWTNDYCRRLERGGDTGYPLRVLFGGPHLSWPSLERAGVRPGSWVYPVRVYQGDLYLIARLRAAVFLTRDEYSQQYLEQPDRYRELLEWGEEGVEPPRLEHVIPRDGCLDEAVLGIEGTPLRFDRRVPGELLSELRYRSQRRERAVRGVVDGKLKSALSFQGVYRLSPATAALFERLLLAGEP